MGLRVQGTTAELNTEGGYAAKRMLIKNGQIQKTGINNVVMSIPVGAGLKVTNIFIDPETGKVVIEYDDKEE